MARAGTRSPAWSGRRTVRPRRARRSAGGAPRTRARRARRRPPSRPRASPPATGGSAPRSHRIDAGAVLEALGEAGGREQREHLAGLLADGRGGSAARSSSHGSSSAERSSVVASRAASFSSRAEPHPAFRDELAEGGGVARPQVDEDALDHRGGRVGREDAWSASSGVIVDGRRSPAIASGCRSASQVARGPATCATATARSPFRDAAWTSAGIASSGTRAPDRCASATHSASSDVALRPSAAGAAGSRSRAAAGAGGDRRAAAPPAAGRAGPAGGPRAAASSRCSPRPGAAPPGAARPRGPGGPVAAPRARCPASPPRPVGPTRRRPAARPAAPRPSRAAAAPARPIGPPRPRTPIGAR